MTDPAANRVFSEPLAIDPAIALTSAMVRLPTFVPGPVHGAQFVVEIAGPKSIPAASAYALLSSPWHSALGEPEVHVMAPADQHWRLMATSDGAGSYDSLALAWDMVSVQGNLSVGSARHLVKVSEQFAQPLGRRAFPFPEPGEVDRTVSALLEAREAFDIGVEVILQGPGSTLEAEIWKLAAALGMDLDPEGVFVWRPQEWSFPVLILAPYEEGSAFSLQGVRNSATFEALSLGFNVPISPDSESALECLFRAADAFQSRLGMAALDEDGRFLENKLRERMRSNLRQATQSLDSAGIRPGSPLALKLFR